MSGICKVGEERRKEEIGAPVLLPQAGWFETVGAKAAGAVRTRKDRNLFLQRSIPFCRQCDIPPAGAADTAATLKTELK
jgi:hypothetical protein